MLKQKDSFEPTYEELKQELIIRQKKIAERFWAYLWGIETLPHITIHTNCGGVLSLPMRNWNSDKQKEVWVRVAVLSLPMRNWNAEDIRYLKNGQEVLSLPMRNWNVVLETASEEEVAVLSLPMRNWNWNFYFPVYFSNRVLSLPMRNWNKKSAPLAWMKI
mgnify:CR=1 FL=1